jgi:hypothetical protein
LSVGKVLILLLILQIKLVIFCLTNGSKYDTIITTKGKEMIQMLTLKYNDLIDPGTFTSKVFDKRQEEIKWLEAKWLRLKSFDVALTGYLQTHGKMSYELYNEACAMFEHSDKTVSEIFREIEKRA